MESKSREQFEAWMSQHLADISKFARGHRKGMYKSPVTHQMWQAWKVSRASLVVELPDYTNDSDDDLSCFDGEYERGNKAGATYAVEQCAKVIRAAGITVKGEGNNDN